MFSKIRSGFIYALLLSLTALSVAIYFHFRPCASPIKYRVGNVDSGFNLSRSELSKDLAIAANIWNKALNKKLFEYDPNGFVTVNLIYDYRQQGVELRNEIDKKNQAAQSVKDQYQTMINRFNDQKRQYQSAVEDFNSKVNTFSKSEYTSRRKELESQLESLNSYSNEINAYVAKYNLLVRDINSKVDVANQTVGEIEQGLYTSNTDTIDIFEYESKTKLVRVLAHELGHALGLDHNENQESIMYKINRGQSQELTEEDLADLKVLCRVK